MSDVVAFCHIPKTAGMALNRVFQSNYGRQFLASTLWGKRDSVTSATQLRAELLAYPRAKVIAGHGIRPFVDYTTLGNKIQWITILRDPVSRAISHYIYSVERGGETRGFGEWIDDDYENYQVRWIAGAQDLDRAIQILDRDFVAVGLQEKFRESLVHFRDLAFDGTLDLTSERRVNRTASKKAKEEIRVTLDSVMPQLKRRYGLDMKLYQHVVDVLWPRQTEASGGAARLKNELEHAFTATNEVHSLRHRRRQHQLHRTLLYKPLLCALRLGGQRR